MDAIKAVKNLIEEIESALDSCDLDAEAIAMIVYENWRVTDEEIVDDATLMIERIRANRD